MIKITAAMIHRYESGKIQFSDPCVICGGKFNECHDITMTEPLIQRIRKLTKKQKYVIYQLSQRP